MNRSVKFSITEYFIFKKDYFKFINTLLVNLGKNIFENKIFC